jgi:hypothetical protein
VAQKSLQERLVAKTEQQLIHRIKYKIKEFDSFLVESLTHEVKAKVTSIGDNCVSCDNSLFKIFLFNIEINMIDLELPLFSFNIE